MNERTPADGDARRTPYDEPPDVTEDGLRVGLGWEVWYLLGLLALAGLATIVVVLLLGVGLDPAASARHPGPRAVIDPWRALVGGIGALLLALAAAAVVAKTDWQSTEPGGSAG